jgi:hypothetical protein
MQSGQETDIGSICQGSDDPKRDSAKQGDSAEPSRAVQFGKIFRSQLMQSWRADIERASNVILVNLG